MPIIYIPGGFTNKQAHLADLLLARHFTIALSANNTAGAPVDLVLVDATDAEPAARLAALNEALWPARPPVILLSADYAPLDFDAHLQLDAWLVEPFDERDLLTCIHAVVRAHAATPRDQQIEALQAQLRQSERRRASLEESERKKDEFISLVSHELKNPMASIKGYADLMRRRLSKLPDDPNLKGLEIISQQVGRMTALLDQLLDFSRINMDRLRLDLRPINVVTLVEHVVEDLRLAATQQIVVETAANPLPLEVDGVRIRQALHNLLLNAARYSPDNTTITVRVEQGRGAQAGYGVISVSDQGIGIAADEQQRVFDRFYRASNVADRGDGLGVGLFIAREIVVRHGGDITVESEPGHGSTFRMVLPLVR